MGNPPLTNEYIFEKPIREAQAALLKRLIGKVEERIAEMNEGYDPCMRHSEEALFRFCGAEEILKILKAEAGEEK